MTNTTPSARRSAARVDLPTALWCRARAIAFYDADDAKHAAALRIAERVLDEKTEDWLQDIVLLVINSDISEHEAVSAILAYLKGEEI